MVAIASSFFLGGRFAALLLSTAFGKDNNFYAIANDVNNMGASLMEQQPGSSSFASSSLAAATADDTSSVVSRRLALCCFNQATLQCHPTTACNGSQKDCESSRGNNRCNESGQYQWGDPNPPPPPAPTNPPTNQPTNVQTPPPTSAPVPPTPSPTNQPVDASCGLCVQDTSISCRTNADCPEVPSGGSCTQGNVPIGSSCTTNGDCGPTNGKPSDRGVCQVGTAPGECDPNLCPPTKSPTPLPTNAPTNPPTSQPTDLPTPQPTTPFPTSPPTSNPTPVPTPPPTSAPVTSAPTNAPVTSSPTDAPVTPAPTNAPATSSPTDAPVTPAPTNAPVTSSPTDAPVTPAPTKEPTPPATPVPTSNPTSLPTSGPTSVPTAQPSGNPTSVPTSGPTSNVETISCPLDENPVVLSPGPKQVASSSATSFCGIFLELESGYLIPYVRSYSAHDWEAAPGPMAAPSSAITCDAGVCTFDLPPPSSGTYVIMTKQTRDSSNKHAIARFLEMTSFGPTMAEIEAFDNAGSFGENERAAAIRAQIDLDKSSHREYFRLNSVAKWDATTVNARSDHPCDANSRWRNYAYIKHDRDDTITETLINTYFEEVESERGNSYTIHEVESDGVTVDDPTNFRNSSNGNPGFSGGGYYDFDGYDDYITFNVSVPEDIDTVISFRYALGSTSYGGNRKCVLSVNNVTVRDVYDFFYTDSWSYWMYSELVGVSLNAGYNTIKLLVRDQNDGPNIDFLRIGKPTALKMMTNGWVRAIAKSGVGILDRFGADFDMTNQTVYFPSYPDPRLGDLSRYPHGRVRVNTTDGSRYLDIGNPELNFDGYESELPLYHFILNNDETFVPTSSDIYDYPMVSGQEFVLPSGLDRALYPVCDSLTNSEEYGQPVFARAPNGSWLQWTPTIKLMPNGPSTNTAPEDMAAHTLPDGGGEAFIQTGEKLKCANAPRTFANEDTCIFSTLSTACSPTRELGEVLIEMNETNIPLFYSSGNRYVFAIKGIVMENLDEHACLEPDKSRWVIETNTTCSSPTPNLSNVTTLALETAILSSADTNRYIKDVDGPLACDPSDVTVDTLGLQIQVGADCYTHVHKDYMNVFDFTGWVSNHPGGPEHIQKWATGWTATDSVPNNVPGEGWYLVFPYNGDPDRKIPKHGMNRWDNNKGEPNIVYVGKFGNSVAYRDLPDDIKTNDVAVEFGATPESVAGTGTIVCGSHGEIANDRSRRESFDFRSNERQVTSTSTMNNAKHIVFYENALGAADQFRQRMAFALSEQMVVVPGNIDVDTQTEIFLDYYDIFVRHAFGSFRDVIKHVTYSPLTAEHLTYHGSKSHAYVYRHEDGRESRPDENFAREIQQLFTIGLYQLNEDGTQVIDSSTGEPVQTYDNDDIMEFARVFTGFVRQPVRGNYETFRTGSTSNRLDPLKLIPSYRDPFPKSNLDGGFLGDGYVRCVDLPSQAFLKKGAMYFLRGGSPLSEFRPDPSYFTRDGVERLELNSTSSLYRLLHNNGQYKLTVELQEDITCTEVECDLDTVRMVKVDGVYYEYKEIPCVQMLFYNNGVQIRPRENKDVGSMCANPDLAHASEACCREERYQEVRSAIKETGVTYFYEGERMKHSTALDRCQSVGKDLCMFEYSNIIGGSNDWWKKGYSWTNNDCDIMVKVNQDGYVAVVHDADISYKFVFDDYGPPAELNEDETLNWFRVQWDGGDHPGSSPENCAANKCKPKPDGSCVCRTSESESIVFNSIEAIDKEQVMNQLFIGALGPEAGSIPTNGAGFIAHVVDGIVDASTVFEVMDKGRTFFLKNIRSEVHLSGWEFLPVTLEAEDAAVLQNMTIKNNTNSASQGLYVDFDSTDEAYVQWDVTVPSTGEYIVSFRYALDTYTRQMELYVNGNLITWTPESPNAKIDLDDLGGTPAVEDLPLQRCQGDCDIDDHCAPGLFCYQVNKGGSEFPGCNNPTGSGSDFCVDPKDIENIAFFGTGGWDDDWRHSKGKTVTLQEGVNEIKIKVPFGADNAPNMDYLKIEGVQSPTIQSKFRNPPHFVSLIGEERTNRFSEQNEIDAHNEVDALLDHLVYHDNVAPFVAIRAMQRFGMSNPSPRYVKECAQAFKNGLYVSGAETFGDGSYGSLEALGACVVLDREATDPALSADPAHGSIREPIIKVLNFIRSFEYSNTLPAVVNGPPLAEFFNLALFDMYSKIGQAAHDFPSVFSCFLPEYIPESGPAQVAQLAAPEATILDMPNIVGLMNGMISFPKYGLSDCNSGFARYMGFEGCSDDGTFKRSWGRVTRGPSGTNVTEMVAEVSLLLTAGRLSKENGDIIETACSSEPDDGAKYRCIQQLTMSSAEFHTTNTMEKSGEDRTVNNVSEGTNSTYKALVYLYLGGGADTYHMLAPHTCAPIDVYSRFRAIRGKNSLSEGIGLKREEMLVIDGNNADQPCSQFGIHPNLPILHELYNAGHATFVSNAGLLAQPVDVTNYRGNMGSVQLFAHNDMTSETMKEDIFQEYAGTGVQGRIADVLAKKSMTVNVFSISGSPEVNVGEAGSGVQSQTISSSGLADFNRNPSIANMNEVILALNNATKKDTGFFAETFASKFTDAIKSHEQLQQELSSVNLGTAFPGSGIASQLSMVAKIMKTAANRNVERDLFYVSQGGYDTHSNMRTNVANRFIELNDALDAFVTEVRDVQGIWDHVTVVQFSEFARTLDPNSGDGSDHGWGGNHFHIGGSLNGGKVRGQFPSDFQVRSNNTIGLSRGRMIPTYPWDAMWRGVAEWFGIDDGPEMDKVLPMHMNFPGKTYSAAELYNSP